MNFRLRQLLLLAREYLFVSVCLGLIVLAAGVCLYFRQQIATMEQIEARVHEEGSSAFRTIAAAATLRSESAAIATALNEIDTSLVTEDNLADNLNYFYAIEDQTHAAIGDLHQNPSTGNEQERRFKTVPVALSIAGTYGQTAAFLHQIETGARQIKITAFTIHRRQPTGDAVNLALELEMLARP